MSLPSPPPDLPASPPLHKLGPGDKLVRFYDPARGGWDQRRDYGPLPELRFDHHLPPLGGSRDRSVWYGATSLVGAVAEAFGNRGRLDKGARRRICVVRVRSPLLLINLVGVAARTFGLDQRIGTVLEYTVCQEWARALYERYASSHGLRWRGRQAGSLCVALNDRADMGSFELIADYPISHPKVWNQVAGAARRARLRIVGP